MKKLTLPPNNQPKETTGTFSATLTNSEFTHFKAITVRLWLDAPGEEIYPNRWILNGSTAEENKVRTLMALTFDEHLSGGEYDLGGDTAKVRLSYTRLIRTSEGGGIAESYNAIAGKVKLEFDIQSGSLQGKMIDCTIQRAGQPAVRFDLKGEFDVSGFDVVIR
ncbi:hypothetical protein PMI18_02721 [Pseudomonas sp. GM102]|uniref:hypothetical protein n=1 Tax=Pseudomonas sp. GM102 TaxID=1144321 RepID=UPI00026FAC38|nr:hypothetical protein [Pseudomonas sp. GM102]EJM01040.1 hypothetical protein PMI18_02721 [Pseudomonas sp. GM102]